MNKFNEFINNELNQPQKMATTLPTGPMIVIAGAGSGKTRVITARMANLILNEQETPESIIALTFTNKAAGEMKERLIKFLGTNSRIPFVGTFHSYCLLILRSNPTLLPNPQFSIMDGDDQKSLIKKILKKNGLEKQFSPADILYQISNAKNKLEINFDDNLINPMFKEIYLAYETEKTSSHCLDFDDLLIQVLKIFQTNKNFRKSFQSRVKHILVDEYQDTNLVQHELLRYMALNDNKEFVAKSICAVGDQDQSIYSWRGAMATNMLKFQDDFAPVTVVKIEQNYRTVQPILDAANSVIDNNKERTPKKLWSEKKAKNRIMAVNCHSEIQEAKALASFIKCLPKETKLSNVAVLYRTHYQSRNIEEALIRNSIAYQIVGGIRFYERKEIKDLLAYLRLIVNPFDRTSFFRVINCPKRGLGDKFEEITYGHWLQNPLLDFKQILQVLLENPEVNLTPTKRTALNCFLSIFAGSNKDQAASSIIEDIVEKSEYISYLQRTFDPKEAESKIENVKEFVQSIYNFEKDKEDKKENTLENFLFEVALMQEKMNSKENKSDQVQCMTLHAAKGLEFNTVIISGLEEGMLPSSRSLYSDKDLEEERRLFYVGITRAEERLVLLRANYRNSFGQISDQVVSRFLTEIPDKLIKNLDISECSDIKTSVQFSAWMGLRNEASSIFTFSDFARKIKPAKRTVVNKGYTTKYRAVTNKPVASKPKFNNSNSVANATTCDWRKNQIVSHKTFGNGIIKKVEPRDTTTYYLTISFKTGDKKILSNFVQRV